MKTRVSSRLILFIVALILPILLVTATAYADGEYDIHDNGNNTVTITGYHGGGGIVNIPASIENKTVAAIGEHAFAGKGVTSVSMQSGVKSIGAGAFMGCTALTGISMPGVVTLGDSAFEGCAKLGSLTLTNGIRSIGIYAFKGCASLTGLTLPDSVTSLGGGAFYECVKLQSITLSSYITEIGDVEFYNCSSLASIALPGGVTSIGASAFNGCGKLTGITLPAGVKSIGEKAFCLCSKLAGISIPNGVTALGDYMFSQCSSLKTVSLPASLKSLGSSVFFKCVCLQSLSIPAGVTSLGGGIFYDCEALQSVTLPAGLKSIPDYTFFECISMPFVSLPGSVESIGDWAFSNCTALSGVTLPGSLKSIGDYAFQLSGITSITIPSGVSSIGDFAFDGCGSLLSIQVQAANAAYSSLDGVLYGNGGKLLIRCPEKKAGAFSIPGGVGTVGQFAFDGCAGLTGITIPASVTAIAKGAFFGCAGLSSAAIPSGVKIISDGVFDGCSGLKSVTIPDGVAGIGEGAFLECAALTSVTLPASVTEVKLGAFYGCSGLTKAIFKGNMPAFGESVFTHTASGFKVYYHVSKASWAKYTAAKQAYCYATVYPQNGGAAAKAMTNVTGGHISAPATPAYAGYSFGGWYKEAACTHAWNFTSDVVSGDVSLYAKWLLAAPANVKPVSASYNSIKITWTAVSGASGYEVHRATSSTGKYALAGTTSSTSLLNTGLTTGTAYYYKVRAYKLSGSTRVYGGWSLAAYAKPLPAAPASITAAPQTYNSIKLTWKGVTGATKYEVYRATAKTGTYKLLAATAALSYTNTPVNTGTTYYYKVRAYRLVGSAKVYGGYSVVAAAKTVLKAPTSVRAVRASAKSVKITWGAVAGATKYEVWRATPATGTYTLAGTVAATSFTNAGLTTGRTYYYKVRAYRLVGSAKVYSGFSAVVSAKP